MFPCVFKPTLSHTGKSGVRLAKNRAQAPEAFAIAKQYACRGEVLAEKYMPGIDVSLIALVHDCMLFPFVILREQNAFDSGGGVRTTGFSIPAQIVDKQESLIHATARKLVRVCEYRNGPLLLSYRCAKNEAPILIEAHPDFGGEGILEHLLPLSTDFSFMQHTLEVMLGMRTPLLPKNIFFKPARIHRIVRGPGHA